MKLSTRARYTLRLMVALAKRGDGQEKMSLSEVALAAGLPQNYLEQLAIGLKRAGLIKGQIGKGGGYMLTRPAAEIPIGQIITAAIGPINIVGCVRRPETCGRAELCECRPVYELINDRIDEVLNEFSLADLAHGRARPKAPHAKSPRARSRR